MKPTEEFGRGLSTHMSGGDPGALGLPPSIFMGLRNSSYETASVPRAMSWGKEEAPLPLVRGEGFRVTATSRGRPSSGMSPPEPGRRAARRLFILRYLKNRTTQYKEKPNTSMLRELFHLKCNIKFLKVNNAAQYQQTYFSSSSWEWAKVQLAPRGQPPFCFISRHMYVLYLLCWGG